MMCRIFSIMLLFTGFSLLALTPDGAVKRLKTGTAVNLEGIYKRHAQGVASDGTHIYWVMSDCIVKSGIDGKVIKVVPVTYHAGDPCWHNGRLYVPVCESGFNKWLRERPSKNWIYVFDGELKELARYAVPEMEFGAGAIEFFDGNFYVAGGRPRELPGNELLVYNQNFQFQRRIPLNFDSVAGIQSINWDGKLWWIGFYGIGRSSTAIFDRNFKNVRILKEVVASYGMIPLGGNRIISMRHTFVKDRLSVVTSSVIAVKMPGQNKKAKPAAAKSAAKKQVKPAAKAAK